VIPPCVVVSSENLLLILLGTVQIKIVIAAIFLAALLDAFKLFKVLRQTCGMDGWMDFVVFNFVIV